MLVLLQTYNDLRALKDIRNAVAHTTEMLHFSSPELAPLIQRLTGWTKNEEPHTLFGTRLKACIEVLKVPLKDQALFKAVMNWRPEKRPASPDIPDEPPPHHPSIPGETAGKG
jgi:hypothetical protein